MVNPVLVETQNTSEDTLDSYVDEILGEAPEEESKPAIEEPEDDSATDEPEAEDADPAEEEAESETPEYITIKHNGKDVELTYDEVLENAQKGFDYTRKTMELAAERKTIETQVAQAKQEIQLQSALITDIAELKSLDNQLAQYSQVNWDAYQDQDPIEAIKAYRRYQELQNTRQQKVGEIGNKQQQFTQQQAQARQQAAERGMAELKASIRDWSPERGVKLSAFAVEKYGFSPEEMNNIYDSRVVRALNDAEKWNDLQAKKPAITKKAAEAPKNVKPGNTPKSDEKTERAKALKQMKNSKTRRQREQIADGLLDAFV